MMDSKTKAIINNFEKLQLDIIKNIKDNNLSVQFVFNEIGIKRTSFYRKAKNNSFSIDEVRAIYNIIDG